MVEVSVGPDGAPRVHRVVCAVDCGVAINPNLIRQQVEGGIVFGLTAALHGKVFLCALSAGGAQAAYCESGSHHFTVRELLQPIEQMAALCGMHYLPPLTLFSAREASTDARLEQHCREWTDWLCALRDDRLDLGRPAPWGVLNGRLADLMRAGD